MTYTPQQIVEHLKALVKAVDRRKLSKADKLFLAYLNEELEGNECVESIKNDHTDKED